MGHRKNIKQIDVEHIATNISIKEKCSNCPMSIYHKDDAKVMLGVGNIYSDIMMILPPYDVEAKIGYNTILKLLIDEYRELTGKELLEDCYVTRYIKCVNKTPFNIYVNAYLYCYVYIQYEIKQLRPLHIISFDAKFSSIARNIHYDVVEVMNPGVLYYDNESLKKRFRDELSKALSYDSQSCL